MTTSSTPSKLEETIASADHGTTVFSDGSTFSYEHGYRSNGAARATRDRVAPTIVKSHKLATLERVLGSVTALFLLFVLAAVAATFMDMRHEQENRETIVKTINESGYAEVVGMNSENESITLHNSTINEIFRCNLTTGKPDGKVTGFVFCSPGKAADFTVELPYDTSDVFYSNPSALSDAEESHE